VLGQHGRERAWDNVAKFGIQAAWSGNRKREVAMGAKQEPKSVTSASDGRSDFVRFSSRLLRLLRLVACHWGTPKRAH